MTLAFTVPGEPRGKGRPRFSRNGVVYTDQQTRDYETLVLLCYRQQCGAYRFADNAFISVDIKAYFRIPKQATKAQRAGMREGLILPSRKPDTDNISKIVLDALNGIAYKDDSRVYQQSCAKYYGEEPRIEVTIREAGS